MFDELYTRSIQLPTLLQQRIIILDGAMGTMIQRYNFNEAAYRGELFRNFTHDVKGNNELLSLTQPRVISEIHDQYFEAGSDIVETNTFGATSIAQSDYGMEHLVIDMNVESAKLACVSAAKYTTLDKPRFVAGAIGPTPKTASISPDVNDPGARNISFDELRDAYYAQAKALLDGGVDLFLVETIFDTLNAKAALFALDMLFEDTGENLPIMISGTVTDASGRILSGQTVEAFWNSLRHAKPLTFGLNCALGAALMRPYIAELARFCDTYISCYPNAGLPNPMSDTGFDETPDVTSSLLSEFAESGLINVAGGCCGTTPDHITKIAKRLYGLKPRILRNCREGIN
ncbi:MAG: homocysteine S-methyltransferase family protein [Burkholderia sp.]|nr:homocysteine S-methyltransferase family protein [Burkholderia sp.]